MNVKRATYLMLILLLISGCATTTHKKEDIWSWPLPPEKPRLKYIKSFSGKDDVVQSKFKSLKDVVAGKGFAEQLKKPIGVAVDSRGRVFVADLGVQCVVIFNETPQEGEKAFDFLGKKAKGHLVKPLGITIDQNDNIYVSESVHRKVYSYNPDFSFRYSFGLDTTFKRPSGVAFDNINNRLYVVDTKAHDIKVFNDKGVLIHIFGSQGNKDGEFNYPTNVAVDNDGKIYIIDTMNTRVQIFDQNYNFVMKYGSADNVPGSFARPKGVALDSDNNVYVVDSAFDNVQIFNQQGQLLLFFGSAGRGVGEFDMPAGIFIDKTDKIYIIDQLNCRVQIFQYLKYN